MLVCVINMFLCPHLLYTEEGIAKVSYKYTLAKMKKVYVFLCHMKAFTEHLHWVAILENWLGIIIKNMRSFLGFEISPSHSNDFLGKGY